MNTKYCPQCGTDKSVDAFNFKHKIKNIRAPMCRKCWSTVNKQRYQENKQYYIDKASIRKKVVKLQHYRKLIVFFEDHPCVDCGETDPVILAFDHLGDKKHDVSNMFTLGYRWETILEEIDKCEVRCMNCHTKKTAKEQNWTILEVLKDLALVAQSG